MSGVARPRGAYVPHPHSTIAPPPAHGAPVFVWHNGRTYEGRVIRVPRRGAMVDVRFGLSGAIPMTKQLFFVTAPTHAAREMSSFAWPRVPTPSAEPGEDGVVTCDGCGEPVRADQAIHLPHRGAACSEECAYTLARTERY